MKLGQLLGLAIVGGVGYYAYRSGLLGSGVDSGVEGDATEPAPVVDNAFLRSEMLKRSRAGGNPDLLNWHQWNYFYAQVRGVPGPVLNVDGGYNMSIDEWLTLTGLSGLSAIYPAKATQMTGQYESIYQWGQRGAGWRM